MALPEWMESIITHANLHSNPRRLVDIEAFLKKTIPSMSGVRLEHASPNADGGLVVASVIKLMEAALNDLSTAGEKNEWGNQTVRMDMVVTRTSKDQDDRQVQQSETVDFEMTRPTYDKMLDLFQQVKIEVNRPQRAAIRTP